MARINRESKTRTLGFKNSLHWWIDNENNVFKYLIDFIILFIVMVSVYITVEEVSSKTPISSTLLKINSMLFYFFLAEYIVRFWLSTDFIDDVKEFGIFRAIFNKVKWIFSFFPIIDLLSLVPSIKALRALRTLRLIKLLRVLRLLRSIRFLKFIDIMYANLMSINKRLPEILYISLIIILVIFYSAIFVYVIEKTNGSEGFKTLGDAFWWAVVTLTTVGYGDIYPVTGIGRFVTGILMLTSIGIIGLLTAFLTTSISERMEKLKMGQIGNLDFKNHIIFCGWTYTSKIVLDEMKDFLKSTKIILISRKENPEYHGIIYKRGDFTELQTLEDCNFKACSKIVVFSEKLPGESDKMVDIRTIMTIFNIESEAPKVHTISEILDSASARIIKDKLKGDEIIYKERVDANLIATSIKNPYITDILYELTDSFGQQIYTLKFSEFSDKATNAEEIKLKMIKDNAIFLGFIRDRKSHLNPKNDFELRVDDVIVYVRDQAVV
ncbi:potassium channel family protein [bacterium]|nr:potassium channel family protein [bacterium]